MKKNNKVWPYIMGAVGGAAVLALGFFGYCIPLNIHAFETWVLAALAVFVFLVISDIMKKGGFNKQSFVGGGFFRGGAWVPNKNKGKAKYLSLYLIPAVIVGFACLSTLFDGAMFNAKRYSDILTVSDSDFGTDLAETVATDSIALMDTDSARKLGDREIGALSDVVSQFDVSYEYTQIDYNGRPLKVAALEYAGFFKWLSNKDSGAEGYITVDPVSMSAEYVESEGMKYIPSAYLFENAHRYIRIKYPTLMLENLHFEIDEEGKPYYIASIVDMTVGLFGGKSISGCVVMDPVSGETVRYELADVPRWVDVVFDGDLICEQYNWYGRLSNGYFNSLFAKKDCKQVTTYYGAEGDDYVPGSDYGYVSKDGDVWIYTGVTSVNGDSSNIGFLLANERTGESRYYPVAGADEKSAMMAAEGEVQEKGYQASFPSLINVEGNPTYIMVLKDSGGLVKLYAAVNVEQYNIVTTAATQSECIAKYKDLLGMDIDETPSDEPTEVTITIASIKYIVVDGNTYIYLIDANDNIYKAKAASNENMLLLSEGDTVTLLCSGSMIIECR